MSSEDLASIFLRAANEWICNNYYADIRYIAEVQSRPAGRIWDASIQLNPLPPQRDNSMRLRCGRLAIGQHQQADLKKSSLAKIIKDAVAGTVRVHGRALTVKENGKEGLRQASQMLNRTRWFAPLDLYVTGSNLPAVDDVFLSAVDDELRRSSPPFDGLVDVGTWLSLADQPRASRITITIGPPVDIIFEECRLTDDQLTVTLHAHPLFDVKRLTLSIRALPGGLTERRHIESEITWQAESNKRRVGQARVKLQNSDSALMMLLIGQTTVRRQWILDPAKARNHRLLAVQQFDQDLRMIRDAVLQGTDSVKFEHGVAALLFMLGFSPSVQLETNAPDLIVATPLGRLVIVECTTRISDFASKIGKLVDRRGALQKSFARSGHPTDVIAALVCRLPRDQIAAQPADVLAHNVLLFSQEDLSSAFDRVRIPQDPDQMVRTMLEQNKVSSR